MKSPLLLLLIASVFLLAFGEGTLYETIIPNHFPQAEYQFKNNPLSKEKIALGRALFYDPLLSKDNSISCATCHSPFNAFAHSDHDLSHGINDQIGTRNAPALMNLAWQKSFMWDGAINHLDMQALAPIEHPKEMGESIDSVVIKLQNSPIYPTLFHQAYEDSTVTGERLLKAISQFQLTLVSANSKYDKYKKGTVEFTEQELKGYSLFQRHCNNCHQEPLFSSYEFANNGLPVDTSLNDFGRWGVTKKSEDSLLFKIPSLRNVNFSFPYMHDGRFKSLQKVLDHYSDGISPSATLSKELENPMELTDRDKVDLMAFLLTLDDKEFVFNKALGFPREVLLKK